VGWRSTSAATSGLSAASSTKCWPTAQFAGETVSDTIARILEREPDWSLLPGWTPPAIRRLLARCLAKDPKGRLRDIGDARIELDATGEVVPGLPEKSPGSPGRRPAAIAAAVVVLSALAVLANWTRQQHSFSSLGDRLAKAKYAWVTEWEGIELDAAISADGKFAAFVADASGAFHVWRTQLATEIFTNLTSGQDEERNRLNRPVGFSTDGTSIWLSGHPSGRRLRLMPFTGGALRSRRSPSVTSHTPSHPTPCGIFASRASCTSTTTDRAPATGRSPAAWTP
jgi:hypothetical protein